MKELLVKINEYANLILVVITAIYAYLTYRMVSIAKSQVIAKITISDLILKSCFAREKEIGDDSTFLDQIVKLSLNDIISSRILDFSLSFDIRNASSGSGSIDKPQLVLKYKNQYLKSWYDAECVINPITTEREFVRSHDNGSTTFTEYKDNDLGKTLFLRGGDSAKVTLAYSTYPISRQNLEAFKGVMALFKDDPSRLEYFIRYTSNLGKNYEIRVEKILSDRS